MSPSRMCPLGTGEHASCEMRIVDMGATCCATPSIRFITLGTRPISPVSEKSVCAWPLNWRSSADRGLQPSIVSQRPHQSRRRHPRLSGSELALDGPDALRNLPPLARAHGRTVAVAGSRSQTSRDRGTGTGPQRRRHQNFLTNIHICWARIPPLRRFLCPSKRTLFLKDFIP